MRCICLFAVCVPFLAGACDKSKSGQSQRALKGLGYTSGTSTAPTTTNPAPPPAPPTTDLKPKSPNPKWKAEFLVYNFGTVWAGDTLTFPFRIFNEGGSTLKILEAKPRCSCSVAENYSKEIPSGQSGVIPFKLNTAGKKGD